MFLCYIKIFFQETEFQGSKDFIFNASLYLKDVYLLVFFFCTKVLGTGIIGFETIKLLFAFLFVGI